MFDGTYKMNTCPRCKNNFGDEQGGVVIKEFLFCSSNCLFGYFTITQIKQILKQ
jgi:hypothetical protein